MAGGPSLALCFEGRVSGELSWQVFLSALAQAISVTRQIDLTLVQ